MIIESVDVQGGKGDFRLVFEAPKDFDGDLLDVVVFVHGLSSSWKEHSSSLYLDLADEVLKQGVGVVRFGQSMKEKGGVKVFSLESRVVDLKRVFSYLQSRSDVGRVCLVGHSFGCAVICAGLGFVDDFVDAYVFLAPKIRFGKEYIPLGLLREKSELDVFERWHLDAQTKGWFVFKDEKVDKVFLDHTMKHADLVYKNALGISKSVSVLVGSKDRLETVKEAMLFKGKQECDFVLVTGANHSFKRFRDYVGEKISRFS